MGLLETCESNNSSYGYFNVSCLDGIDLDSLECIAQVHIQPSENEGHT